MRKKERENSDRIARVKNLLPDDLKALVVSLDASRYVSAGAPAGQAAELVEWANAKQRIRQLDMVLDRLEQDNSPRKPDADPTRYLEELRLLTGYIDIRGLQVSTEKAHRFPIEELFIPLTTGISEEQDLMTGTGRMEAAGSSPRNLHEALRSRTLVIIGDPGAGKSTFLKYVAKTLCDAWLDGKDENLASRLGFTERLFPILIDVAVLTEHVSTCRARQEGPSLGPQSPDWIPHYLGCSARARKWELDEAWFHARLIGYEALVMLDGLDEAASEATRNEIGEMVRGAARAYPRCRFVITSRPAAYIGTSIVPDFDHAWIEPLPDASIKSFIGHWCAALFHYDTEQAEKHQRELVAALCSRPAIRRLARNPVMLTALAVVHWNEKRLPEQRAALYQSIIKWLARSREHKKGRLSDTRILELLQKLALAMQDAQPSRRVQVPRRWAAERLAPNWPDKMEDQRIARADFFLAAEEVDSGIIVSRGIELRFWHLTFQEYLAARALAAFGEKRQNEVLLWHPGNLHASEWREVVLLFAGILCDQGREKVDGMVSSVLDRLDAKTPLVEKARVAGLPGEIVRDLAPFQFRPADVR